jgi:heptosyltransferase I
MPPHFDRPPLTVCLLRLSAIGDTCHAVAALRMLQAAWPGAHFTWIIGKLEARLMTALLPEVEFIIFDKRAMAAGLRSLRRELAGRRFDLLLHLQLALRASLVSTLIRARLKLGFDRARARELQWLFTNARIAPARHEHVLDSFLGFVRACGIEPGAPRWDLTLPDRALEYADGIVGGGGPTLVISPCSSHVHRNWRPERYAAVACHARERHGMRVVLAGGPSATERRMGEDILRAAGAPATAGDARPPAIIDQIGKDTLPELLGLLSRSTALLTPDSGPAHMATMVGLPVIGLYAATRTARAGPYLSREWCIDKYDQAARTFRGRPADRIPWTDKIEVPGVMDLIGVAEVAARLDALMAARELR